MNRAHDLRMAMAVSDTPPGCDCIYDSMIIRSVEISTVATHNLGHLL